MKPPDLTRNYLNNVGRYVVPTAQEVLVLARKVQKWQRLEKELQENQTKPTFNQKRIVKAGRKAAHELWYRNLRLVIAIAKHYSRATLHTLDLNDLIQEGNIGLYKAILRFDPERGYKLSTYSTWWIRQAVTRSIKKYDRPIRVSEGVLKQTAVAVRMMKEDQAPKSDVEFYEFCKDQGMDVIGIKASLATKSLQSLDITFDGHDTPLADAVEAKEQFQEADEQDVEKLEQLLKQLDMEERSILEDLYGLKSYTKTPAQIAQERKTSATKIHAIKRRALAKLQSSAATA